jgi:translocation and assembly module TamB
MGRAVRLLLWGGATLAAVLVLLIVGGWAALGTESGRRFIADRIELAASDASLTLSIGKLSGALPAQLDLDDITVADRDGPVVRIAHLSLSWRPFALLAKRLSVQRIALSGVSVDRLPAPVETTEPGGAVSLATGFDIDIEEISARDITLAAGVAGSVAYLSATGSFGLAADASRGGIGLDIRRIDGSEGRASLVLDYAAEPPRFAARLDVEEPSGGPIAALAGMTGEFPLTMRLDGAGPPDAWQGRLVGKAGPSSIELDLVVGVVARTFSLRIDGAVQAGTLLPDRVVAALGSSARVSAALSFGADTGVRVESARVAGERLTLSGSGSYRPETGAVAGDAVLEMPEAAGPLRLPAMELGAARMVARVSGTVSQPVARLEVSGAGLVTPLARLGEIEASFDLASPSVGQATVKGSARLAGIAPGEPMPQGLLGPDATIVVDATWSPEGFSIAKLALASEGLSLTADGRSDEGVRLAGNYEIAKSGIGTLLDSAALGGDLRLVGSYRIDLARLSGEVELVGDLDKLRGNRALLGSTIALTGAVARAEDGRIDVIGLEIAGTGGTLRGRATLDPAGQSISAGHLSATLPDLSRLAAGAGMPVSGRASFEADIAGPLDALTGTGRLRLEQIAAGAVSLDHAGIGFGFKTKGAGAVGSVKLALAKAETRLPGSFDFSIDAARLRISEILFAGDGNRLWGNLDLDLASGLTRGAIDAQLADVASLGFAAAGPVSGALTLGGKLEAAAGQRVTLSASGTSLRIGNAAEPGSLTIGGLTLAATIEDALRARRINGKVELRDFARDQAAVSRATLEVATDRTGDLRFDGAIEGSYGDPLSLRVVGTSTKSGDGLGVALTRLDGSVGAVKIALTAPARFLARDPAAWSGTMALLVGGGNVTATAAIDPGSVALSLVVAGMPLAAIGAATRHLEPGATWSVRLDLSGAPSNPRGAMAASAQGLRPAGASWNAADALAIALDGTLADGRVSLAGRISGPDSAEVTATASMPVTLSLGPVPAFAIPDGAIAGKAALRGRLEMVEALVDIGENWISGAASASIELAGTTRAPQIRGSAQLADGRFEGVQTGVVVREIEADLRFDGTRLQIARLSASDAGQGRLTGTGEVRFEGDRWPLDLGLTFTGFSAITRDDATLSASGEVRMLGDVAKPRIEGRLTVDGGEIRIPDRIGTSVVSLDVVEINRPAGAANSPKESRPATPAPQSGEGGIALDVTVVAPGRVFVRGRGLDSEWSGDLTVAGTTAQPRIAGVLSVVRGSFALAGRNLAVNQGSVTFRAGQFDPEIDARATLQLGSTEVTVRVSGRASAPSISLSAVPSMPSEDILALMLFGKSAGALTAFQAAQLARSSAALSGNFSGDSILDRARRGLGVDALTVESEGETARGTALRAGKYVADGVFVTVQQGATADSQKVAVEVEVTPSVTVETGVGPSAGSSIGLNWKLDY